MDKGKLASILDKIRGAPDDVALQAMREADWLVMVEAGSWRVALGLTDPPSNNLPHSRPERARMILEWFKPRLNTWEQDFLFDMAHREGALTDRQRQWVDKLCLKYIGKV